MGIRLFSSAREWRYRATVQFPSVIRLGAWTASATFSSVRFKESIRPLEMLHAKNDVAVVRDCWAQEKQGS
jgi:hypothetical protein